MFCFSISLLSAKIRYDMFEMFNKIFIIYRIVNCTVMLILCIDSNLRCIKLTAAINWHKIRHVYWVEVLW